LELRLEDRQSGDIYWSGGVNETEGSVVWLYVLDADFHYDSLLKRGLRLAFTDLSARLAQRAEQKLLPEAPSR